MPISVPDCCTGCGKPLGDDTKVVSVIPTTTRAKDWVQGSVRLIARKTRLKPQPMAIFHDACWPGLISPGAT